MLSHLCKNLGVAPTVAFYDVLSTSEDLLSCIPRPVHALILLCDRPIYYAARAAVEPTIPDYQGCGPDEPVRWMKQTIGNACGLMALLHCLFNLDDGKHVTPGSQLEALMNRAVELGPEERARLLYESKFLEEAHMDAASTGCSTVPSAQEDPHFHFVGFVKTKRDGKVWELNGCMNGPLLRGTLEPEQDLLGTRGLQLTVQDFLDAAKTQENRGIGVSLVAVTES